MHIDVTCGPAYAAAVCRLGAGESVFVERSSMAALSGNVSVTATFGGGGLARGLTRKLLTEQTLVVAKYTASRRGGGWVRAVPPFPGDIAVLDVGQTGPLKAQTGSVLAYAPTVDVTTRSSGTTPLLMHEGLTAVGLSGTGQVALATYGGIEHIEVPRGEHLIVDSGHLVAWSAGMKMKSGPLGGPLKAVLTGELWVGEFHGPGHVLIQSRAAATLRGWLFPEGNNAHV
ncbi:TIGR00266 family protein [Actinoallomurus sp. NPDC052274]|uniref:TIGR00266 family protein n=1 Tax=Actinoallomurus sp. NPDC052274 TaxID=3155420 RepID=UPI00344678F5